MDIPSLQVNPSSLVNILTLRYDPTQKSSLPKYTPKNFVPSQEIPSLEKIEKLIIKNITSKIPKDTDSISIALSGGDDSTLVLAFMRKIFPKIYLGFHRIQLLVQKKVDLSRDFLNFLKIDGVF